MRGRVWHKPVVIVTFLTPILYWYLLSGHLNGGLEASEGTARKASSTPEQTPSIPQFVTTDAHNAYVEDLLTRCETTGLLRSTADPGSAFGDETEEDRYVRSGCGKNQTTLVILASQWFQAAYTHRTAEDRHPTGEMIYAESFMRTLEHWGYSYVFTGRYRGDSGMKRMMEVYERWEGNVRLVVADPAQVEECWDADWCARKEEGGVPVWKLFSFWYWDSPANPLGPKWTLSPSAWNNNTLLSYSIQRLNRSPTTVSRMKYGKPQTYLMAKSGAYLDSPQFPWSLSALASIRSSLGIRLICAMNVDTPAQSRDLENAGIENLPKLREEEFHAELAKSSVLIGVGLPKISPSPWEALYLGTPFVNPIINWDSENKDDRSKWVTQHDWMLDLDPPYVYHVHAHDLGALRLAVQSALRNPIDSFVPPRMTWEAVCGYTASLLEHDWAKEMDSDRLSG